MNIKQIGDGMANGLDSLIDKGIDLGSKATNLLGKISLEGIRHLYTPKALVLYAGLFSAAILNLNAAENHPRYHVIDTTLHDGTAGLHVQRGSKMHDCMKDRKVPEDHPRFTVFEGELPEVEPKEYQNVRNIADNYN